MTMDTDIKIILFELWRRSPDNNANKIAAHIIQQLIPDRYHIFIGIYYIINIIILMIYK